MELVLTPEESARRRAIRDALAAWGDRDRVRAVMASGNGADLDAIRALAAHGWFDPAAGVSNVAGQTLTLLALAMEQIGRHPMPGPWQAGLIQGAAVLDQLGHPMLAAEAARGERWTIWCGDGARVAAAPGAGGWRLTGTVPVVADAALADLLLVPASMAGSGPPGVFAVPAGSPGLWIEPVPTVGGDRAARIRLDGVAVNGSAMLGADPLALANALDIALVVQCAELFGVAAAALDVGVAYVTERRQWGRPMATFQAVQHGAADCFLDIESMRWAVLDAAGHADSGRPLGLVASLAKVVCSEGAMRVTAWAHQVHGGEGFYADRDPGLFYRRARALAPKLGDVRYHLGRIDDLRRGSR
jgi:alkylation response protein AidB-like acyl-CoA dehydrogenase